MGGAKMKKVGGYLRLSDEDRFKNKETDYSESINNQRELFLEFVSNHPDWQVYDIYIDDDISGASKKRPEFERLIKDCENGLIDIVICKSQSRFTRTMEEVESILHNKFIEWDVRFIGIVDHADTEVRGNKKARQINGLVNEWYLEDGSENIKSALNIKRKAGQFTGSFAPYGYLIDPNDKNHLIIDPITSEVVKEIFTRYANGDGYQKIREYLNGNNILSPNEYKKATGSNFRCGIAGGNKTYWRNDTIAKFLRNEYYLGRLVQRKTTFLSYKNKKKKKLPREDWIIVDNAHDAIIDEELWYRVEERLNKNHHVTITGEVHMLSKKVYCAKCNKIYHKVNYNLANGKAPYLRCKSKVLGGIKCDNKSINYQHLTEVILQRFNLKIKEYLDESQLNTILNNEIKNDIYIDKKSSLENEIYVIETNLAKKRNYMKGLYEDRRDGILSDDDFIEFKNDYDKEIKQYQSRLNIINEELKIVNFKQKKDINVTSLIKKYKNVKELNKEILDEFIERIYIHPYNPTTDSRDIEIEWILF